MNSVSEKLKFKTAATIAVFQLIITQINIYSSQASYASNWIILTSIMNMNICELSLEDKITH